MQIPVKLGHIKLALNMRDTLSETLRGFVRHLHMNFSVELCCLRKLNFGIKKIEIECTLIFHRAIFVLKLT